MGLGTYLFGPTEAEKVAKQRSWDDLVAKNPRLAQTAEEYNVGLQNYMKTGALPTTRNQEVRTEAPGGVEEMPGPGGLPIRVLPETSVEQKAMPIRMGRPGYAYNQDTGQMEDLEGDVSVSGNNVFRYNPNQPKQAPGEVQMKYFDVPDPITGEMRKMSVLMQDGKPIRNMVPPRPPAPPKAPGAGGANTPEMRAALQTMRAYQAALKPRFDAKTGQWIPGQVPGDLEAQALDAAQVLGMPTEEMELTEIVKDPGFAGWMSRVLPGGETGMSEETTSYTRIGTGGKAKPAPKPSGKTLTRDQAADFLKRAGGDKEKARQMAKDQGYSF